MGIAYQEVSFVLSFRNALIPPNDYKRQALDSTWLLPSMIILCNTKITEGKIHYTSSFRKTSSYPRWFISMKGIGLFWDIVPWSPASDLSYHFLRSSYILLYRQWSWLLDNTWVDGVIHPHNHPGWILDISCQSAFFLSWIYHLGSKSTPLRWDCTKLVQKQRGSAISGRGWIEA